MSSNSALPPPTVMTTSSGNMSLGSSLTLTCIVGVLEGLLFLPDIMWTKHVNGDSALNSTSVDAVRSTHVGRAELEDIIIHA